MKCPVCGIEMMKKNATEWVCRNKRCVRYPAPEKKEEEKKDGD